MLLSREDKDLRVESHAPPGSQASPRGEAKDSALLPSRDADILVPPEWPQGKIEVLGWSLVSWDNLSDQKINHKQSFDS